MSVAISIVVLAYRQQEALIECLRACEAAADQVPEGAELIVIDNGGLADLVRACSSRARVLEPGANLGFAAGANRGVDAGRGRWVALVNDDARLAPAALACALETGERHAQIGSVATQVRFHSAPAVINSAGLEVDSLGIASERLAGRAVAAAQEPCEVFGASGCFALYRATMMRELGGFDRTYFAYLEDVDLAWRARAAGWTAVYDPRAFCYHRGSASTGEGSQAKYYLVGRNRVRLLARNATTGQLLRALPGIVLYDSAYIAYVALRDRTVAPLRGRLAGIRGWTSSRRAAIRGRRRVKLRPATRGWIEALRMHRAYRDLAVRNVPGLEEP